MDRYLKSFRSYVCPKCGSLFHHQLHRSLFMKGVSAFLPLRQYYCAKCKKGRYIILKRDTEEID